MTGMYRLPTVCAFIVLMVIAPAHGHQFSDWSTPINLGPVVNSSAGDFFAAISKEGLSLYFTSPRVAPGAQGGWDIYVCQRASVADAWGPPRNLGPEINTAFDEGAPTLSADGHRMYFSSNRQPGGFGGNDIYVSRRRQKRNDFGWQAPENLGSDVNTSANETSPAIFEHDDSGVGTLYFDSNRPGGLGPFTDDAAHNGNDIYSSVVLGDDSFAPAQPVAELSSVFFDRQPAITRDGLEMFFASNRPVDGVDRLLDVWVSTRATPWDPWGIPVNLQSPVNTAANDAGPAISFDGRTLYFHSIGSVGAFDLFVSTRTKLKE